MPRKSSNENYKNLSVFFQYVPHIVYKYDPKQNYVQQYTSLFILYSIKITYTHTLFYEFENLKLFNKMKGMIVSENCRPV